MSEAERRWVRVLMIALQESVKLQGHYAELLNMHDCGERLVFRTPTEWIARLAATGAIPNDEIHQEDDEAAGGEPKATIQTYGTYIFNSRGWREPHLGQGLRRSRALRG